LAITRERKEELVASYVNLLEESNGFAIVKVKGLSVGRVENLRRKIREAGGAYVVAKNTLITKALEQTGWTIPEELLAGPNAIVFGGENFPGVSKALLAYLKDEDISEELVTVSGGVMGTDIVDGAGIKAVSELPTLPELQAQIIGLIVQPSRNIVNILQQADSGVVNVLQAWLDKDGDDGEAA
jgi:large subunit ribosomal protein L10